MISFVDFTNWSSVTKWLISYWKLELEFQFIIFDIG